MDEEWKPIAGYDGLYEISNKGNVMARERLVTFLGRWGWQTTKFDRRMMKISRTNGGYCYVSLSKNSNPRKYLIHRLVMSAFVGDSDLQVNHKDGDKNNNCIDNLEYCTSQQNLLHCTRGLKKKIGEGSGTSKLKANDINAIRNDRRLLKEIANDYGVTPQAIWLVKARKNWAHIG